MKIEQLHWTAEKEWGKKPSGLLSDKAQLVLVFGERKLLTRAKSIETIKDWYPHAKLMGCSTAGEICGTRVSDESLVVTAVQFEKTTVRGVRIQVSGISNSFEAGQRLGDALEKNGLVHVVVFSDGLKVNGSELVRGLTEKLPESVTLTGGLSGDGARFEKTVVLWSGTVESQSIVAVGFYGKDLKVGYGSMGGWDPFGPERLVTRSAGNVLYELDGQSALDLYKQYLGEHAKGLPATGLLFPLCLRADSGGSGVVRTILSVDEKAKSMTFAGDVPAGSYTRLMKANFDRLIDGAQGAARTNYEAIGSKSPELAILISCVGRKLVLKQRIEEEVEGVRDVLGPKAILTGFYSYGEISPFTPGAKCELHNQTMTITTFSEK